MDSKRSLSVNDPGKVLKLLYKYFSKFISIGVVKHKVNRIIDDGYFFYVSAKMMVKDEF